MAEFSGEVGYRGEFLVSRYHERERQPWDSLRAEAEQTSRVVEALADALVESRNTIGGDALTALFRLRLEWFITGSLIEFVGVNGFMPRRRSGYYSDG
jgi:hypothetical protein